MNNIEYLIMNDIEYIVEDLKTAIKILESPIKVYERDKYIHPSYALEKIKSAQCTLDYIYDYLLRKGDEYER